MIFSGESTGRVFYLEATRGIASIEYLGVGSHPWFLEVLKEDGSDWITVGAYLAYDYAYQEIRMANPTLLAEEPS